MNTIIYEFVKNFENEFRGILRPDESTQTKERKFSEFFIYDNEDKGPPTKVLSDWDLRGWFYNELLTQNLMRQIDSSIREFKGFSDVGLFTMESGEKHTIQYMIYTPDETFAPFLDLHLVGPFERTLTDVVYRDVSEYKKWALLTAWRKIKNGDADTKYGTKVVFRYHLNRYWPSGEGVFIDDPEKFFRSKLPNEHIPEIFLN